MERRISINGRFDEGMNIAKANKLIVPDDSYVPEVDNERNGGPV